jgi:hypothetical protein
MFVDFWKLLEVVDMDGSFPMRRYTQSLDLRFKSYEVFNPNCQNLPKSAQSQNFEMPPKFEILVFFKNKISMCRSGIKACFHRLNFQSNFFSYAIFIVKKRPLYVNFSLPLVEIDDFFKVPHVVWTCT